MHFKAVLFVAFAVGGLAAPPGRPGKKPIDEQKCPKGQEWNACGSACPPRCGDTGTHFCTLQCLVGCQCEKDLILNEVGECVKPEDCSKEYGPPKWDDELRKDRPEIEKPTGPTETLKDLKKLGKDEPEKGTPKSAEPLTNQQAQQPAPAQPTQAQPLEAQAKRPPPNRPLPGNGGSRGPGLISYHESESWKIEETTP